MAIIEKNENNLKRCLCPNCPTYNDCAREHGEKLFCSKDTEKTCKFARRGCICPVCPVHKEYKLTQTFYCINGPAEEVEGEKPKKSLNPAEGGWNLINL